MPTYRSLTGFTGTRDGGHVIAGGSGGARAYLGHCWLAGNAENPGNMQSPERRPMRCHSIMLRPLVAQLTAVSRGRSGWRQSPVSK